MDEGKYTIQGFKGSAVAAGIKKGGEQDLGLIFSEKGTAAAGVFTTNKVKAAPVVLSREHLRGGEVRAIIANSGNANACTGQKGLENARRTAERVASELGIRPQEVLVASTGVIGSPLNMELIDRAIPTLAAALSPQGLSKVAEAIMTTDSFPKMSRFEGKAGDKPYHVLGIAKGAGMIMPDMATLLCFVLSDIRIDSAGLGKAVLYSAGSTFNRISVDGDTSTNDMVLAMANRMAGNSSLSPVDYQAFQSGLTMVMDELARMIVRDGEGATKVVTINLRGAATNQEALEAAQAVANSSLVKTAFYGQDPNWGRIMAALGRSRIRIREQDVSIWIDDVKIVEGGLGRGTGFEEEAAAKMANKEFSVTIDLHQGAYEDRIITCDLTQDYVKINADYRT